MKIYKIIFLSFLLLLIQQVTFCQEPKMSTIDSSTETGIQLETPTGVLYGILSSVSENPKAVVVLIAGSGPTDRNGNGPGFENNSLKYLADTLTSNDWVVLRYDKRGVGGSKSAGKAERDMRFEDMTRDARQWLRWVKRKYPDLPLIVAGHSEGALVGAIAGKEEKMDGYISLCGPAFPADSILKEQLTRQSPIIAEYCSPKLDSIKQGLWVVEKNPMLQSILRESVQPYLYSWMQFDPREEAKGISVPSLFIGAGKDLQVPPEHALILSENAPDGSHVIIEDMNHILKKITGNRLENSLSYNNPSLPIHKQLAAEVIEFIIRTISK